MPCLRLDHPNSFPSPIPQKLLSKANEDFHVGHLGPLLWPHRSHPGALCCFGLLGPGACCSSPHASNLPWEKTHRSTTFPWVELGTGSSVLPGQTVLTMKMNSLVSSTSSQAPGLHFFSRSSIEQPRTHSRCTGNTVLRCLLALGKDADEGMEPLLWSWRRLDSVSLPILILKKKISNIQGSCKSSTRNPQMLFTWSQVPNAATLASFFLGPKWVNRRHHDTLLSKYSACISKEQEHFPL